MMEFDRNKKLEFSAPEEIRKVQEGLLKKHVHYLASAFALLPDPFQRAGDRCGAMSRSTPCTTLPLTDKTALSLANDDFLAVPLSQIVDIVLSSGTTGKSTTMMYTENDLRRLAYNEEISFTSCGLTRDDIVLLTCTMDRCFIAGLAYFSGVRSLGAAAIRNGLSSVDSHLEIIQRLKPTAIVGVPTFLLKLGQLHEIPGHRSARVRHQKTDLHRRTDQGPLHSRSFGSAKAWKRSGARRSIRPTRPRRPSPRSASALPSKADTCIPTSRWWRS